MRPLFDITKEFIEGMPKKMMFELKSKSPNPRVDAIVCGRSWVDPGPYAALRTPSAGLESTETGVA